MSRYITPLAMSILVSLTLFYFMQHLISGEPAMLASNESTSTIEIIRLKRSEVITSKQRRLPDPIKQTKAPKSPEKLLLDKSKPVIDAPKMNLPLPELPSMALQQNFLSGVNTDSNSQNENTAAIPLMKIEPKYPRKAARKGIEGWVKLEFTVLEDGSVTEVKVLEAKPKRLFNKSAIHAIRRWKFKPHIVNGSPIKQNAVQIIEFNLK